MTIHNLLESHARHVAIVGAFGCPREPKDIVVTGPPEEVRRELRIELVAERRKRGRDGAHSFWTYGIHTPAGLKKKLQSQSNPKNAEYAEELDEKNIEYIDASGGAFERYLSDPRASASAVGAKIVSDLAEAAQTVFDFWHAAFAAQLTEGLFHAVSANLSAREIVNDELLRRLLHDPVLSTRILGYLRAGERQTGGFEEGLAQSIETSLKARNADTPGEASAWLAEKITEYRRWLEGRLEGRTPQYLAILDGVGATDDLAQRAKGFAQARREMPIPGHTDGTLRQIYSRFRASYDLLERVAHSEPLMAFAAEWYLCSFVAEGVPTGDSIAGAIFDAIYRNNREAQPSLVPEEVHEKAAKRHRDILEGTSGAGGDDPIAHVRDDVNKDTIEARSEERRTSAGFSRDDLCATLEEQMRRALAAANPGRRGLYQCMDAITRRFYRAERALESRYERKGAGQPLITQLNGELDPILGVIDDELVADLASLQIREEELDLPGDAFKRALKATARGRPTSAKIMDQALVELGVAEANTTVAVREQFLKTEGERIITESRASRDEYRDLLAARDPVAGNLPAPAPACVAGSAGVEVAPAQVGDMLASAHTGRLAHLDDECQQVVRHELEALSSDLLTENELAVESGDKGGHALVLRRAISPEKGAELVRRASTRRAPAKTIVGVLANTMRRRVEGAVRMAVRRSRLVEEVHDGYAGGSRRGREREATGRMLAFGEHLAALTSNGPLGRADTSFYAKILLHLLSAAHPDHATRGWRQRGGDDEATKALRAVPLWEIVQPRITRRKGEDAKVFAARFESEARVALAAFVKETQIQTAELLKIGRFQRSAREVTMLLDELAGTPNVRVTIVNMLLSEYTKRVEKEGFWDKEIGGKEVGEQWGGPLVSGPYTAMGDPIATPPGIVYVSPEAFEPEAEQRSLEGLAQAFGLEEGFGGQGPFANSTAGDDSTSRLQCGERSTIAGLPIVVGTELKCPQLPVLSLPAATPSPALVIGMLMGIRGLETRAAWQQKIGREGERSARILGYSLSSVSSLYALLRATVEDPEAIAALAAARTVSIAAFVRQLGEMPPIRKETETFAAKQGEGFRFAHAIPVLRHHLEDIYAAIGDRRAPGKHLYVYLQTNQWQQLSQTDEAILTRSNATTIGTRTEQNADPKAHPVLEAAIKRT